MRLLNIMILTLALIGVMTTHSCGPKTGESEQQLLDLTEQRDSGKIQILNFGTFHMGFTTDEHTTEFNENDKKNQEEAHAITQKLAAFQPTVILVESTPFFDSVLQARYNAYLLDPDMFFKRPTEIELIAFELGRLTGVKRIYGIDHKMDYNYNIGFEMTNEVDSIWHNKYYADPLSFYPEVNQDENAMNLLEKLQHTNHEKYLDFLVAVNADMLTHAGSKSGFEGADEAAKFYQRNLRMYTNLNRLALTKEDRVFIIMGASHTAFFRDFMKKSPKYQMVNTFDYLK